MKTSNCLVPTVGKVSNVVSSVELTVFCLSSPRCVRHNWWTGRRGDHVETEAEDERCRPLHDVLDDCRHVRTGHNHDALLSAGEYGRTPGRSDEHVSVQRNARYRCNGPFFAAKN